MKNENEEEEFIYDDEEAAKIILQNISDKLKNKLNFDDIMNILALRDEYFEKEGLIPEEGESAAPIEIDDDLVNHYIITNAVPYNIILSKEEIEEIMEAELIYLEINGLLEDDSAEIDINICEKCKRVIPFGTPHYTIVKNLEFYCENPKTKEAEIEVEESEQIIALCKSCGSYFNNENLEIILKHLPIPGQEIKN